MYLDEQLKCKECNKYEEHQGKCPYMWHCGLQHVQKIIQPFEKIKNLEITSISRKVPSFEIKTSKPLIISDYINNNTPFFVHDNRVDKMFNDFYYNGNFTHISVHYGLAANKSKLQYSNKMKRMLNQYLKDNKEYKIKKVRNKLQYILYYQNKPITRQMNYTEMERLLKNMKKVKQI